MKGSNKGIEFEEVSCAGLDGTPWPEDTNKGNKENTISTTRRRPCRTTRASDKTADSGRGVGVIGWLPEQMETAEETLMRAAEMWRERAMRGDPDAPHSRVLRALRGEDF